MTIFSSSNYGKNVGFFAVNDYDELLSSQSLFTFVILSLRVGNIKETKGDLPEVALIGVKLTNIGLISPRGEYSYLNLNGALK